MLRDVRQRNRSQSDSATRKRTVSFADESSKFKLTKRQPSILSLLEWCNAENLIYFFFTFVYFCGILLFVHRCHSRLLQGSPKVKVFDGVGARNHLKIISSIGVRTAGSYENDILTVKYLVDTVNEMIHHSKNRNLEASIELQFVKQGGLTINRYKEHFSAATNNITNVLVFLRPKNRTNENLVLINSHYDTQPGTKGASDATASCAIMLQAIEMILRSKSYHLANGLLFLFNGAEEAVLVGTHGYVTQHPSMKHVLAFINLEAGGSGGKQMVFQAGPGSPWISDTYAKKAPHPFASVFAQEVFESQLIPSDTDFRVFRDYGNVSGIDMAYCKNGYVYHTRNDIPEIIPTGSLQSAGDNLMALISGMANSPYLTSSEAFKHGKMTFFDVYGLFAISLPYRIFKILNIGTAIVCLAFVIYQLVKPGRLSSAPNFTSVALCCLLVLISIISGGITIAFVAFIITKTGYSLLWYSQPLFGIALYGGPCVSSMLLCHTIAKKLYRKYSIRSRTNVSYFMEDSCIFSYFIIYSFMLLYLTNKGIQSSFIILFWVAFPFIGHLISRYFRSGPPRFVRHLAALISSLVGHFIAASITLYIMYSLYEVFIPIAGRSGTEVPSEAFVGLIVFLGVTLLTSYLISSVHVIFGFGRSFILLSLILYLPLFIALSGFIFPYTSLTAKRLFVQHTMRTFYDIDNNVIKEDSGIWLVPYDYLAMEPLMHIDVVERAKKVECDGPYCGYPALYPIRFGIKKTWYAEASKPMKHSPVEFKVISKTKLSNTQTEFVVTLKGPSRMNLYLVPAAHTQLIKWNVTDSSPKGVIDYDKRTCYYVYLSSGYYSPPWIFSLILERSEDAVTNFSLEFAVGAHHLQGYESSTKELSSVRAELPTWVVDVSFVSFYDRWLI